MLNQEDVFVKLKFSDRQLDAIKQIHEKYFDAHMPDVYNGTAFVAFWREGSVWETGKGLDARHNNAGIALPECRLDPLWQEFSDLLPFMSFSAIITKLPPGAEMIPHVDRKSRPECTIYIPVRGCTEECVSSFYDLPKRDTQDSYADGTNPTPLFNFSVSGNAILETTREWHGVKNNSELERVAFGWNMLPEYTFSQAKDILTNLGYI